MEDVDPVLGSLGVRECGGELLAEVTLGVVVLGEDEDAKWPPASAVEHVRR